MRINLKQLFIDMKYKIGIAFSYREFHTGGTYYVLSIINSLNYLEEENKPDISIFYSKKEDIKYLADITYPKAQFYPLYNNIFIRGLNKILKLFTDNFIFYSSYTKKHAQVVYPYVDTKLLSKIPNRLYWIADLQDKYYPEFFSQQDLAERNHYYRFLLNSGYDIIFSSDSSMRDYIKFYNPENTKRFHVLNFCSIIDQGEIQKLDISQIKSIYNINKTYIICPNAMAIHKNHMLVLKAAILLKQRGVHFQIVFTGKEYESRFPDYPQQVKKFALEAGLEENIRFLGFIDRNTQLSLILHAALLLQPSLFEGWNTGIEEAKSMNKYIVASDLDVHKEQITDNVSFFYKSDPESLADILQKLLAAPIKINYHNYGQNIQKSATQFLNIVSKVVNNGETAN